MSDPGSKSGMLYRFSDFRPHSSSVRKTVLWDRFSDSFPPGEAIEALPRQNFYDKPCPGRKSGAFANRLCAKIWGLIFPPTADIINLLRRSTQAGRRGVTRNLVGRESVARVRIPSPPPKKDTPPYGGVSFFDEGVGFERAAPVRRLGQKQSGGLFLARGRIHSRRNAPGWVWACGYPVR